MMTAFVQYRGRNPFNSVTIPIWTQIPERFWTIKRGLPAFEMTTKSYLEVQIVWKWREIIIWPWFNVIWLAIFLINIFGEKVSFFILELFSRLSQYIIPFSFSDSMNHIPLYFGSTRRSKIKYYYQKFIALKTLRGSKFLAAVHYFDFKSIYTYQP